MIDDLFKVARAAGIQAIGTTPAITEVRNAFPWAQSVISAAICYLPPERTINDDTPKGQIAKFAQSADYHAVLRAKLEIVAQAVITSHPAARLKICVDTAPIPERKLAVLTGIATRGKNGNVCVKDCGSYAALGEIITNVQTADAPQICSDFSECGSCNLCMQSCPTGAIIAPGVMDTTRCVSRLTQMSGIIPRGLRPAMEAQIYGCDICQKCCPRNASILPSCKEFDTDIFPGSSPELIPLLKMSIEDFKKYVKESSIGWIRRNRIRRNAAIAAGNLKCTAATDALIAMLQEENPILQAHAAWALGEINTNSATEFLRRFTENIHDPIVAEEIHAALANKCTTRRQQ